MEPQPLTPHSTPESEVFSRTPHTPEVPASPQRSSEGLPRPQERGERQETRERVTGAGAGDASPAAAVPQSVQVPPATGHGSQTATNTQDDDTPLVAADEDLIEMEWVNKAKKIVNETKTDPYQQERAVSRLQASYLLKRYGKEVKLPKDE